jgi:hypothetical protein
VQIISTLRQIQTPDAA